MNTWIKTDYCQLLIVFTCTCFFLSSGLGRFSQAEEYLAQAQWTVLKTPECTDDIKSKLFRNLGLLYAAQGNYPDALSQLADDVSPYFFLVNQFWKDIWHLPFEILGLLLSLIYKIIQIAVFDIKTFHLSNFAMAPCFWLPPFSLFWLQNIKHWSLISLHFSRFPPF